MQEPDKTTEHELREDSAPGQADSGHDKKHEHHKKEDHKHLEKEVKELRAENEKLSADASQFKDAYARKVAEFDNYRKRVLREMDELRLSANKKIILDFITVFDNLRRAIESTNGPEHFQALFDGLRITFDQMRSLLEKNEVKPIDSKGAAFDHACHEALMMEEREDVEHDMTVVEEFEKGYMMGASVLKPAKVKVAKKKSS